MIRVARYALALLAVAAPSAAQQPAVRVVDLGPGASGRIIADAVARPYRLIEPDTAWFVLRRGERDTVTLVVLGRTVAVEGSVQGDVIVVGGDLHVRPSGRISGRAIAIGGGVYPSALAVVSRGSLDFRDNTFAITRAADGYELRYQSLRVNPSPPLLLPGIYGLRIPTYDRVNGASIPFGPSLSFLDGKGELDALVTWRSDIGKIDPLVHGTLQLSRRTYLNARVGRETISNENWIWSDLVNSLSTLVFGSDTRNWFRADRAELTLHHRWEFTQTQIEPFAGGRFERAWSVGPVFGETSAPWSIWGRDDSLGMRRPNPSILDGHIASALGGALLQWGGQGVAVTERSFAEVAFAAPSDRTFTQVTSDLAVVFPTFGDQDYALDVHWVTTPAGPPPNQRYAYVGGSGTLPFDDMLDQGGDELLLIDQRYSYPVNSVTLGLLGSPTLLLRHRLGSAGLGRLPAFHQMIGLGVMLTLVRAELQIEPESGRARFSAGFSFSR